MLDDLFEADNAAAARDLIARPLPPPPKAAKFSAWSAIPRGAFTGMLAEPAASLSDIAGAIATFRDTPSKQMERGGLPTAAFSSELGDSVRDYWSALKPDPQTASTAEQVLFGFSRGLAKLLPATIAAGPAGAIAAGVEEAMTVSDELRRQGVQDGPRQLAGIIQGTGMASAALPLLGRTLAETAALYVAGGPGGFMAQQALTREILRDAGHDQIAAGYDPFDPVGLAVASLIPAGFTAYGLRGQRIAARAKAAADFNAGPVPSEPTPVAAAVADAYKPAPPRIPPEVVDAAMVQNTRDFAAAQTPAVVAHAEAWRGHVTENPNFKAWFGDSKVVDAEGSPLVVYHGTTADVQAFDLSYSGADGVGYNTPAIFATTDVRLANDYAVNKFDRVIADAMRAMQAFKNENPGTYDERYERAYDAVKASFNTVKAAGRAEAGGGANVMPMFMSLQNPLEVEAQGKRFMQVMPQSIAEAVAGGHDGLIVSGVVDNASPTTDYPAQVIVAFRPEQIKSAIGNSGRFDPNSASLTDPVPRAAETRIVRSLPPSDSLALPPAPTADEVSRFGKVENIPLAMARATQSRMEWARFDAGDYAPPLVEGFSDIPLAVRKLDGEVLVFDGHHRTADAINRGETEMPMRVLEAKDYAPEFAGRKPAPSTISDDELMAELSAPPKPAADAVDAVQHADPAQARIDATPTEASIGGLETREVPVKAITLSEDVPQFKSGANAAGVVEPLGGSFDRTGVAPIQLWERTDGRLEVISGRHRLDLARRSGEETIPAQIHREADGFDVRRAAALDAELNIRDGQGKVRDYVDYFSATGIDRATAEQRGLLARSTGKRAYAIANDGSPELIAAHRAGAVSDEAAVAIAGAAPGDSRLQAVGIRAVQDGKTIGQAANTVRAVKLLAGDRPAVTGDMFGFDDSAMREAESMAKIATAKQREIATRLSAITGAAKRPELAKAEGVNVKDSAAVLRRVEALRAESAAWDNWTTNPTLIEAIRADLHPDGAPLVRPEPAPETKPVTESAAPADTATGDMFGDPIAKLNEPADAKPKPAADPIMSTVAARVADLESTAPDMVVRIADDGKHVTLADDLAEVRRMVAEGTDDSLGTLDADLMRVAVECALSTGG